ncbi:hypothetical protein J437_LFUL018413 [Ladona fulva]|uniref:Tetraspanin n=1 Tax=Ladona fulva TaxID=123851 RepID=A0A8K0NX89_LADFU|nr:hypothetical protein J437_LFUL018413 [Ladona fulva]
MKMERLQNMQMHYNTEQGVSNWLYKRPSFYERIRNLRNRPIPEDGQRQPPFPTYPAPIEEENERVSTVPFNFYEPRNQWNTSKCVSYLYYALIVSTLIFGILLLMISTILKVFKDEILIFVSNGAFWLICIILMSNSLMMIITSTIGLHGITKGRKFYILIQMGFSVFLATLMVTNGFLDFLTFKTIIRCTEVHMKDSLSLFHVNHKIADTWNGMQQSLNCCGVNGYKDWCSINNETCVIPGSCCLPSTSEVGYCRESGLLHPVGCIHVIEKILKFVERFLYYLSVSLAALFMANSAISLYIYCC